ncbi:MAG: ATP-dependent DNA helicase RecG [bacterium]|nr:ATP-dependent DNA helicase RecG [bacterium]
MKRSVTELRGVGAAKAQALLENCAIETIGDLLYYFPRRYLDRTVTETTLLKTGEEVTLVVNVGSVYLAHGRKSRLVANCRTLNGEALSLVWFRGVQYLRRLVEKDTTLVVSGKLDFFSGMQMVHPDFELLDPEDEEGLTHVGRIVPLYPSGEALKKHGLDSRGFRRLMALALDIENPEVPQLVPEALRKKHGLYDRLRALRQIHYPDDAESLAEARRTLKYEELYLFNILMYHKSLVRERIPRRVTPLPFGSSQEFEGLKSQLPFELTKDQKRTIEEIVTECRGEHSEAYLLQGDVGSGKTVVALSIALHYMEAGVQAAIIAPTEVLARQHYRTVADLLGLEYANRLELLTGQRGKKKDRELKLERIASGEAALVIGTHSLIEPTVVFHQLGLVIIDEQHRFGVEQRETIREKGVNPDTIAMTATPIPRTLCLSEFADLKLATLKEKPAGRKPIKTMWLRESRRAAMYKSVHKHVSAGRQCFIVYPMIAESEKVDLKAATAAFEELDGVVFPDFRVELLHGKMKPPDKERVMTDFRLGKTQILVTTSVIEVGVDVPNATVMVIEHAERFGISQLHQLRGRVGRGTEESFCVLMSEAENEEAVERLEALVNSEDGFYLAEVDLKIRGPGQLLGLKQHGLPGFRIADLVHDRKLTELSYADARENPEIGPEAREFIRKQFEQGIIIFPN